ncbi:MAG TPA: hypothetical protein VFQ30_21620 [Ktedonobacteraceae bacterium]|nr:hypothetical protein [Ktedonobacteraceae bacterium]
MEDLPAFREQCMLLEALPLALSNDTFEPAGERPLWVVVASCGSRPFQRDGLPWQKG